MADTDEQDTILTLELWGAVTLVPRCIGTSLLQLAQRKKLLVSLRPMLLFSLLGARQLGP